MKQSITRYVIIDPTTKFFWQSNFHYGYTTNNKSVFDTRFTDTLSEATLMSKKEAEIVLERFAENEYVQRGNFKVDGQALVVVPVKITYKL